MWCAAPEIWQNPRTEIPPWWELVSSVVGFKPAQANLEAEPADVLKMFGESAS